MWPLWLFSFICNALLYHIDLLFVGGGGGRGGVGGGSVPRVRCLLCSDSYINECRNSSKTAVKDQCAIFGKEQTHQVVTFEIAALFGSPYRACQSTTVALRTQKMDTSSTFSCFIG